jgi:hypothetical protein
MTKITTSEAVVAPPLRAPSAYTMFPTPMRAYELPQIRSLAIRDLFPDIPEPISGFGSDPEIVRKQVYKALEGVDMSMIKPTDRVNVLCHEHGFNLMGGQAYADMLKIIKQVVEQRTGCMHIRLRFATAALKSEGISTFLQNQLIDAYDGEVDAFTPYDEGMRVPTEIGDLYVIKKAFDCEWFIHTHYDDPREIYFNRLISRDYKPFAMSYARLETRSTFHMAFGPRSENLVPRAIFETPIIHDKHAFTIEMRTAPTGILGIEADNDIDKLDRRGTVSSLKYYGKMFTLFRSIDEVVSVLDVPRWVWYGHCGGMVHGILMKSHIDNFDLDILPDVHTELTNPAVKSIVVNHTTRGLWGMLPTHVPIYVAGQLEAMQQAPDLMNYAADVCDDLPTALDEACERAGTDKVLVFDGSYGSMNLSESMAQHFIKNAPEAARKTEEELLPKWLKQRGIDPAELDAFEVL